MLRVTVRIEEDAVGPEGKPFAAPVYIESQCQRFREFCLEPPLERGGGRVVDERARTEGIPSQPAVVVVIHVDEGDAVHGAGVAVEPIDDGADALLCSVDVVGVAHLRSRDPNPAAPLGCKGVQVLVY